MTTCGYPHLLPSVIPLQPEPGAYSCGNLPYWSAGILLYTIGWVFVLTWGWHTHHFRYASILTRRWQQLLFAVVTLVAGSVGAVSLLQGDAGWGALAVIVGLVTGWLEREQSRRTTRRAVPSVEGRPPTDTASTP